MNGTGRDITGEFVVLHESAHKPEFRSPEHLLFRAGGGFGCLPETMGTTVVGHYVFDGERAVVVGTMIERIATDAEVEAVFKMVFDGADDGACPACNRSWDEDGARVHLDGCEYLKWMAREDTLMLSE